MFETIIYNLISFWYLWFSQSWARCNVGFQVSWALEVCYLRRHSAAAAALASASAAARGAGAVRLASATGIDTEESGKESRWWGKQGI